MGNIANRDEFVNEFSNLILSNNATVFMGSGLSLNCGMPSWNELLKEAISDIYDEDIQLTDVDYYFAADVFARKKGREALNELLESKIPKNTVNYGITDNHRIITRLPFKEIWTSNYDLVIEHAYQLRNKSVITFRNDNDITYRSLEQDVKLFKVHGCISDVANMVVTQSDVQNYHRNFETMEKMFFSSLASQTFLFLGFGFKDQRFNDVLANLFTRYNGSNREHYAVIKRNDKRDDFERNVYNLSKYNIRILPVDSYKAIPLLLKDIEKKILRTKVFISGSHDQVKYFPGIRRSKVRYDYQRYLQEFGIDRDLDKYENQMDNLLFEYNGGDSKSVHEHGFSGVDNHEKANVQFESNLKRIRNSNETSNLSDISNKLGYMITRNNLALHCGNGEVITDSTVNGALKAFKELDRKGHLIPEKIRIIPLGKPYQSSYELKYLQSQLLTPCGFHVCVGGGKYFIDFYSGTFREYEATRKLSSVLLGWQYDLFDKIKALVSLPIDDQSTPLKADSLAANYRKRLSQSLQNRTNKEHPTSKQMAKEIDGLISKQSELIYYKYQEIIGIFTIQFYKLWKFNNKNLESKRATLAAMMASDVLKGTRSDKDPLVKSLGSIMIKFGDFQKDMAELFIGLGTNKFHENADPLMPGIVDDKKGGDLFIHIKRTIEIIDDDLKGKGKSPKHKGERNLLRLKKYLKSINLLLQGNQKYYRIHNLWKSFNDSEIFYTKSLLSASKDKESGKQLIDRFNAIEVKIVNYCWECILAWKNGKNDLGERGTILEGYYNYLKASMGERIVGLIERITDQEANLDALNEKFEHSKNDSIKADIKYLLRLFTVSNIENVHGVMLPEMDGERPFDEYVVKEVIGKLRVDWLNQHSKEKNGKLDGFYRDLLNRKISIDGKNENFRDYITSDRFYSRRYVLVYRIQLYKLVQWLADLEDAFYRNEYDILFSNIKNVRRKNAKMGAGLWSLNLHTDQNLDTSVSVRKPSELNIRNPWINDPNDLDEICRETLNHAEYYKANLEIHHHMVDIKRILTRARDQMLSKQHDSWKFPAEDELTLFKNKPDDLINRINFKDVITTYDKLIGKLNNINEVVSRQRASGYFDEPYRSATVVLPIGYYGSVSLKIWYFERYRFELLLSAYARYLHDPALNKSRASKNLELLICYYNLMFPGFSKSVRVDPQVSNDEIDRSEINDQIIESIESIIGSFK